MEAGGLPHISHPVLLAREGNVLAVLISPSSGIFCFGSSLLSMGELESQILCVFAVVVNRDALTQPQRRRRTEAIISAKYIKYDLKDKEP